MIHLHYFSVIDNLNNKETIHFGFVLFHEADVPLINFGVALHDALLIYDHHKRIYVFIGSFIDHKHHNTF